MSISSNKQSPMVAFESHRKPNDDGNVGITIEEHAFLGFLNFRFDRTNEECSESVKNLYGTEVPQKANTFSVSNNHYIYWLGPDEWLLRTTDEDDINVDAFRNAVNSHHTAVTDVSGAMTLLRLSGESVQDVLRQGTTFDIDPLEFEPGNCAQTVFAHANVIFIRPLGEEEVLELIVRRSFSDHIMLFLLHAASDYGYELKC